MNMFRLCAAPALCLPSLSARQGVWHVDLSLANGQFPLDPKPNVVRGCNMAGEISALGSEVKGWNVGDRVCAHTFLDDICGETSKKDLHHVLGSTIDGDLAEYVGLIRQFYLGKHHPRLTFLRGLGVTACNALVGPAPLHGGDIVLVQGTGRVSVFALQFAIASGATAIATLSSYSKLWIAAKPGAKHPIKYLAKPDREEEVLKITAGRGMDHIIEVGGPGTLMKALKCVRFGG